ncbi:MAG: hypothetical protein KUL77_07400 [Thermomonas sp.]|uniref:hypothetical protein n=1 Tax=Thermomonas sp. TaxID=1971895 RepID=UPI001ECAED9B|nr:hypothetical protein [Thermomonas sp.]MBV2209374.1 hypothetical protein [Thermomonas sp.]
MSLKVTSLLIFLSVLFPSISYSQNSSNTKNTARGASPTTENAVPMKKSTQQASAENKQEKNRRGTSTEKYPAVEYEFQPHFGIRVIWSASQVD